MPEKRTERCVCCELPYFAVVRSGTESATTDFSVDQNRPRRSLCPECRLHQGDSPEQRLKRYEVDHPKLRSAMQTAKEYAERKERENKAAREQVASALRSREHMARSLKAVQEIHTMRGDGSCACGIKKNCRTAETLYGNRWVQGMLGRVSSRTDGHDEIWSRQDEGVERREPWMDGVSRRPRQRRDDVG